MVASPRQIGSSRRSQLARADRRTNADDVFNHLYGEIVSLRLLPAIAGLLDEFGRTRTVFSGACLRMVYELPDNARNFGPEASG